MTPSPSGRGRGEGRIAEELRRLWKLALPLAFAQGGQALMGMVDTAVVGRLSTTAQGAAGLGNSLTFTACYFGMGMMLALDPLVSQAIGARDERGARIHWWTGVWLAGFTSVVIIAGLLIIPFVLVPVGVNGEVAQGANTFILWRLPGVPGTLLFVGARSYLQGRGKTAPIFWAMIIANIVNVGLDVLLVFGAGPIPPFGLAGAAIATDLSIWLQVVIVWFAFDAAPDGVTGRLRLDDVKRAARLGMPIGLQLLAESGLFSLAGVLAGTLGKAEIAAHQVALTWASMSFSGAVGIGSAASVRVGWAVGAKDTGAARRTGFVAFGSAAAFMTFTATFFLLFPEALARVMTSQPDVIRVAAALFMVTAIFQISDGVQAVGAGAVRGLGDTQFPFWANVIGHWLVGLPVAYLLGVRGPYGVVGLWWGLSAGLTCVAVALLTRFALLTRREVRALESTA